jgi:hypothetical protein
MRTDNLQQYVTLRRQLTQERDQLSQRLATLDEAMGHLPAPSGGGTEQGAPAVMGTADTVRAVKRNVSPAARARIAEGQRKRWAAARGTTKQAAATPAPGKRQFSPAARRKIADAARKRWAAAKRAGKNRL